MPSKAEELQLDAKSVSEDQGAKGATNLQAAVAYLADASVDATARNELASALSTWVCMAQAPVKTPAMMEASNAISDALISIMLTPDDSEYEKGYYSTVGVQQIAETLVNVVNMVQLNPMEAEWAKHWSPFAFKVLDAVSHMPMEAASPGNGSEGPSVARANTIQALLRSTPNGALAVMGGWTIGDVKDPCATLSKYSAASMPAMIKTDADAVMLLITQHEPEKMGEGGGGVAKGLIDRVVGGDTAAVHTLTVDMYEKEPEPFDANFMELLTGPGLFMFTSSLLMQIAQKNPKTVVPHVAELVDYFVQGKAYKGMETMVLHILKPGASVSPAAFLPHLAAIEPVAMATANCDMTYAMMLGDVGKGSTAAADECVERLCSLMPKWTDLAIPVVFNQIINLLPTLSGTNVLKPHMDAIKSKESHSHQQAEKIRDWYQGRSLAHAYDRLDELDVMVAEMNDQVAKSCSNFEEVKAYVDKHIAELKDFVGEIAKKLPQPSKLTIIKGLRRTVRLHFACARSGVEWTCDSKDWSKWMKMGFSLMKLGKCALDLGMGNPLGLAKSGVDAIRGVYKAYKEKDDAEFDTYIQQPFLTSQESDKLLKQLREGGYFDMFAYDAQLGAWVALAEMSGEDARALLEKNNRNKPGADAKTVVKGKNLGFGSAKDIAAAAGAAAKEVGLERHVSSGVSSLGQEAAAAAGVSSQHAEQAASKAGEKLVDAMESKEMEEEVQYSSPKLPTSKPPQMPREKKPETKAAAAMEMTAIKSVASKASASVQPKAPTSSDAAAARGGVGLRDRVSELEKEVAEHRAKLAAQDKAVEALKQHMQGLEDKVASVGKGGGCCTVM